jgi:integrase
MNKSRSYSVNFPRTDGQFAQKYPALAHIPFIMDSQPAYHRDANSYLIDRGLGRWNPEQRNVSGNKIPATKSMKTYAAWLANFLEWADRRNVDLYTCDYATHVNTMYQGEMIGGYWSHRGNELSPNTVNARVSQACDFLNWMVHTGRRTKPFPIPTSTFSQRIGSATSAVGHRGRVVETRKGKVKRKTRHLQMPTRAQTLTWLVDVYSKNEKALGLMGETILKSAMRREEVVCLRVDTLPEDRDQWDVANRHETPANQQVRISIKYGTKGTEHGVDHGDKVGPERTILIPLTLAEAWHDYRSKERVAAFGQWVKEFRGAAWAPRADECVHLFLRGDGVRYSGKNLYDGWHKAASPLYSGARWSPHDGRHWWACMVLWEELKKYETITELSSETKAALVNDAALSIIRLQIQPQLGHADIQTSMIYVNWVIGMLALPVKLNSEEVEGER